jgi:hypothetical protein
MDRQLSQLTALVDQLMDAARISSGKIVLDWKDRRRRGAGAHAARRLRPASSRMPAWS